MTSYYDHNAKSVSWEVLPFPAPIEVKERQLTDAEAEQFRREVESYVNRAVCHVGDDAGELSGGRGFWRDPR